MGVYIVKRLFLIIPTLFGIMVINFLIVQTAPGGPVEQIIAQLSGHETEATARITGGGGGDLGDASDTADESMNSAYEGARGLDVCGRGFHSRNDDREVGTDDKNEKRAQQGQERQRIAPHDAANLRGDGFH